MVKKKLNWIYLFGLRINRISKSELLENIENLIITKTPSYVVTPYSEFFLTAQKDLEFKQVLNHASLSIPDGVSITLALKYFKLKGIYWPLLVCLFSLVFNRNFFKLEKLEKLSGSDIIYDVSKMAALNGRSIYFLGGFDFGNGNTGELTAKKLQQLYPGLKVAGTYSGSPKIQDEDNIISEINKANPDILYIAYGPVSQEKWIFRNYQKLSPCVSFCLGGTFDFVSGEKKRVPKIISKLGLEWLFRPIISERGNPKMIYKRISRGWVGVINYILLLINEKKKITK